MEKRHRLPAVSNSSDMNPPIHDGHCGSNAMTACGTYVGSKTVFGMRNQTERKREVKRMSE